MYLDHLLHSLLLSFFPSSCLVSSSNATTLVDVCLFVPGRNSFGIIPHFIASISMNLLNASGSRVFVKPSAGFYFVSTRLISIIPLTTAFLTKK